MTSGQNVSSGEKITVIPLPQRIGDLYQYSLSVVTLQWAVLIQHGDYSSFTLAAGATMHREIISNTSSYSSNRYVSITQTGQVVDRNANCFTGWWPCNLHASCCMLTVNNYLIQKHVIVAYRSTPTGIFVAVSFSFFIFLVISWPINFLFSFHLSSLKWKTTLMLMKVWAYAASLGE